MKPALLKTRRRRFLTLTPFLPAVLGLWVLWATGVSEASEASEAYSVAILEQPSWDRPGSAAPSFFAGALDYGAFEAVFVSPENLSDPEAFHGKRFSLLVLPYGGLYPAKARENLLRFLHEGGDIFATGGAPFRSPMAPLDGRWFSVEERHRRLSTEFLDIGGETDDFRLRGSWGEPRRPGTTGSFRWTGPRASVSVVPPRDGPWRLVLYGAVPEGAGEGRISFSGKPLGGIKPKASGRWEWPMAPISSKAPYGAELLVEFSGGLDDGDSPVAGMMIRSIKAFPEGAPEPTKPDERETFGPPIWGPPPSGIGVIDRRYSGLRTLRSSREQGIISRHLTLRGRFDGFSAVCSTSGRLVPLVFGFDAYGRRGPVVGALCVHSHGSFAGGNWAFFGMDSTDIWRRPEMGEVFLDIVSAFARGIFLAGAYSDLACYKPGETASVWADVVNSGPVDQSAEVQVEIYDAEPKRLIEWRSEAIEVPAGRVVGVTFEIPIPLERTEGYQVDWKLYLKNETADVESLLLDVFDPAVEIGSRDRRQVHEVRLPDGDGPGFSIGADLAFLESDRLAFGADSELVWGIRDFFRSLRDAGTAMVRIPEPDSCRRSQRLWEAWLCEAERAGVDVVAAPESRTDGVIGDDAEIADYVLRNLLGDDSPSGGAISTATTPESMLRSLRVRFALGGGPAFLGVGERPIGRWTGGASEQSTAVLRAANLFYSGISPESTTPETVVILSESSFAGPRAARAAVKALLDLGANVRAVRERDVGDLPEGVRLLIWPIPTAPSDAAYEAVLGLVRSGTNLYVSGDLSYDPSSGRQTRTPRLVELCGVELFRRRYEGLNSGTAPLLKAHVVDGEARAPRDPLAPMLEVRSAGAQVLLEDEDERPLYVRRQVGRGWVEYNLDPTEARFSEDPGLATTLKAFYLRLLERSRVEQFEVGGRWALRTGLSDGGECLVLGLSEAKGEALPTVFSRGEDVYKFSVGSEIPAALVWDASGNLVRAAVKGDLLRNGRRVVGSAGYGEFVALDGKDLARSRGLGAVSPSGLIRLAKDRDSSGMAAVVWDIRDGVWSVLEEAEARGGGANEVEFRFGDRAADWDGVLVGDREAVNRLGATLTDALLGNRAESP